MPDPRTTAPIALSVVIPVYNQEAVLTALFDHLYPVLDALGQPYEAVFVDDGSRDRSATLLRQQYKLRLDTTLDVRTVDSAGAPLAGIPVALRSRSGWWSNDQADRS